MSDSAKGLSLTDLIKAHQEAAAAGPVEQKKSHPAYPVFTVPKAGPEYTKGEHIRAKFSQLEGWYGVDAIKSDRVPKGNFDGASPIITNPVMSFTVGPYDGLQWMLLYQMPDMSKERRDAIADYITKHYYGSGSLSGLIHRMRAQLLPVSQQPTAFTKARWEAVCKLLPFKKEGSLPDENDIVSLSPVINPASHPGAPWFKTGVNNIGCIVTALEDATEMLGVLRDEGAAGLVEWLDPNHPKYPWMVMMLAPKADVYLREEYLTKTRPFGFTGLALRLLSICAINASKIHLETFVSHPDSINAIGFSWKDGGAYQLVEWVNMGDLASLPPGMHNIAWGDDQLIHVKLEDGTCFVFAPDVSGMDMKANRHIMYGAFSWMLTPFSDSPPASAQILGSDQDGLDQFLEREDLRIGEGWISVYQFLAYYYSDHPVLTAKQYLFRQTQGLLSGLAATTLVDEFMSADLVAQLRTVPLPKSITGVRQYIQKLLDAAKKAGYPLKPESCDIQFTHVRGKPKRGMWRVGKEELEAVPQDQALALTFLGMKIKAVTVSKDFVKNKGKEEDPIIIHVPCMDTPDLIRNLVLKNPSGTPEEVAGKKLQGLLSMGYLAMGDPVAYEYLAKSYNLRISMGHRPYDGQVEMPLFDDDFMHDIASAKSYPSAQYYLQYFATPEQRGRLYLVDPPESFGQESGPVPSSSASASVAPPPPLAAVSRKEHAKKKQEASEKPRGKLVKKKDSTPTSAVSRAARQEVQPESAGKMAVDVAKMRPNVRQQLQDVRDDLGPAVKPVSAPHPVPRKPTHPSTVPPTPGAKEARDANYQERARAKMLAGQAKNFAASTAASLQKKGKRPSRKDEEEEEEQTEDDDPFAQYNEEKLDEDLRQSRLEEKAHEEAEARESLRERGEEYLSDTEGSDRAAEESSGTDDEDEAYYDFSEAADHQAPAWMLDSAPIVPLGKGKKK